MKVLTQLILLTTIFGCTISPKTKHYSFNYGNDVLYARVIYWANNRIIAFSNEKKEFDTISDFDINEELVYKGDFPIYFKLDNDTLYIYGYSIEENNIPTTLTKNTTISIKQINIANFQNISMMSDTTYVEPMDFK